MSGSDALKARRYLHTIHAAPSCERLRRLYCDVLGGIVFSENYYPPEDRDAALLYVADHMIEVMAPRDVQDLGFMYARYLAKAGPSYHSISFAVADFEAAHAAVQARGIQLTTVGPRLMFVHPKSSGGVVMELTDHSMPNDPADLPNWRRDWAAGRPDRPHAIGEVVLAPRDPARAVGFLTEALGGTAGQPFAVDWPQPAIATPVQVADAKLVVLEPADRAEGPLAAFAAGPNGGVYALAWRLADPEAGAAWFGRNGIDVEPTPAGAPWSHQATIDGARHWFMR